MNSNGMARNTIGMAWHHLELPGVPFEPIRHAHILMPFAERAALQTSNQTTIKGFFLTLVNKSQGGIEADIRAFFGCSYKGFGVSFFN